MSGRYDDALALPTILVPLVQPGGLGKAHLCRKNRSRPAERRLSFFEEQGSIVAIAGDTVEAVFTRAVKESFDPVFQKWLAENRDALVERVKPEIRDWLDENFPALLEEAIRSELARAKPRSRR